MTNEQVEVHVEVHLEMGKAELTEDLMMALLEELDGLAGVEDPDGVARLSDGSATVEFLFTGTDGGTVEAIEGAMAAMRTAFHAAGLGTQDWPRVSSITTGSPSDLVTA